MNKIVQWLQDDQVLLRQKIGMVALGFIAILAAGWLIGYPVLFTAVVTTSSLVWGQYEKKKIKKADEERRAEENRAVQETREQMDELNRVKQIFGGPEAWEQFPILPIRIGNTGYPGRIDSAALARPVMKGTDPYNRPFVCMKLRSLQNGTEEVLTIFQRYVDSSDWYYTFNRNIFLGGELRDRDWNILRQMLAGTHPLYAIDG